MTRKLFISYSHKDEGFLRELSVHLRPAERRGRIEPWFDGYILVGDDIDAKVRDALAHADLIALIVSPDFLASNYCYDVEMREAVTRHEAGTSRLVPIIARRCQWHDTPFGRLRATPTDGKPISQWADRDEAWTIVAQDIEAAAKGAPAPKPQEARMKLEPLRAGAPLTEGFQLRVIRRVTQKDKDEFREYALELIRAQFDRALGSAEPPLSGRVKLLDAHRFTATLYDDGARVAGCTIFTGSGHFGQNAICFNGQDNGETNSMNEWLSVETDGEQLFLKPGMSMGAPQGNLTAEAAAEFLWNKFVEPLKWRRK